MPVQHSMFMNIYALESHTPSIKHHWVAYTDINNNLKRALVAGEDAKFVYHHGFDWAGIQGALKKNDKKGKVVAGGSTISQQLAKNLFLFNQRSYIRKGEEVIITWMMERFWSKQRILEVYLNSIEFGEGIYGAEAAAQFYFDKPAADLSRAEAAKLAGLVPNPKFYQKHPENKHMRRRTAVIQRYIPVVAIPE